MKPIVCVLMLFCGTVVQAQADKKTVFSLAAEVGYTTGEKVALWGTGLGVSGQAEYFFKPNFSGTFLAGYINYLGFSIRGTYKPQGFTTVPIRAGARYYFTKKFYCGGQVGIGILGGGANLIGAAGTAFSYSPQVGYKFNIKKRPCVDVSFKYDAYTYSDISFGAAGFRIAYCL